MSATILVTGGAGFIGGAFVRSWLDRQHGRIVNLDKLTYAGNLASLEAYAHHPDHFFVAGDIGDQPLVRDLLEMYRPAAVVNFAAESHVDRSIDGPAPFVNTNVVGTCALLEEVRAYWMALSTKRRERFRFLQVSTDEVFGSLGPDGRFTEESPFHPNSPYAASKAAADHFVQAFHSTYGLPTLTTHASNNYGPFQFPEKLIPLATLNAIQGLPIPVYGDGQNVRDWLFVEDHCRALQRILRRGTPGTSYNIGGSEERTNLQVVEAICDQLDLLCPSLPHRPCRSLITFVADRPGHDRRYAVQSKRLYRELRWRPKIRFEEGLAQTVRWYVEHSDWVHDVQSGEYRRERLGTVGIKSPRPLAKA